ncbi:MAG: hypothetical protein JWQ57_1648 [Mucilaginibacter sp.]|nr:hypothetical protein [Mucilaginibacter sp.]
MKRVIIIAVLLLYVMDGFATMRCDTDSVAKHVVAKHVKVFDKIQLRQSFQDATEKEDPAQLMLSIPSSGRNNWLVDVGLAARFVPFSNKHGAMKIVGEFHRNTLIDSVQYNWQAGLNYAYLNTGKPGHLALAWTGNLKYVRDVTDTTHSIVTSLSLSFYRAGKKTFNIGRPGYLSSGKNTYQVDPSIQVQFQQYLGNDTHNGAIVRPLICLAASYAWNGQRTKGLAPPKKFEIALNYINRYALINKTSNDEGYSKLLRAGVNYYFLNTKSSTVSLGMSYNIGSDPMAGLKDQNYLRFAFQVQI